MTNYQKIESVVSALVGLILTGTEIVALVQEKFPGTNAGSILPGDMAHSDAELPTLGAWAKSVDCIFAKVGRGTYRVLPESERIRRAGAGRESRTDLVTALANAKAKIAELQAHVTSAKPLTSPVSVPATATATASATKANGATK